MMIIEKKKKTRNIFSSLILILNARVTRTSLKILSLVRTLTVRNNYFYSNVFTSFLRPSFFFFKSSPWIISRRNTPRDASFLAVCRLKLASRNKLCSHVIRWKLVLRLIRSCKQPQVFFDVRVCIITRVSRMEA